MSNDFSVFNKIMHNFSFILWIFWGTGPHSTEGGVKFGWLWMWVDEDAALKPSHPKRKLTQAEQEMWNRMRVWGRGSLLENGGLLPLRWRREAAHLIHEWREDWALGGCCTWLSRWTESWAGGKALKFTCRSMHHPLTYGHLWGGWAQPRRQGNIHSMKIKLTLFL